MGLRSATLDERPCARLAPHSTSPRGARERFQPRMSLTGAVTLENAVSEITSPRRKGWATL